MQYIVKFVYDDGKDLDVSIEAARLQDFFSCLDNKQVFWADKESKSGFWLDLKKVRFVQLTAKQEEVSEPKREDNPSESELLDENDGASDPKGDAQPA